MMILVGVLWLVGGGIMGGFVSWVWMMGRVGVVWEVSGSRVEVVIVVSRSRCWSIWGFLVVIVLVL